MSDKSPEETDIYRDTPVRYLGKLPILPTVTPPYPGYANEVGESFRSIVGVNWVRLSYAVSIGYVLADTIDKGSKTHTKLTELEHSQSHIKTQVGLFMQIYA